MATPLDAQDENDFPFENHLFIGSKTLSKSENIIISSPDLKVHDVLRFEGKEHLSKPFSFELYMRLEKNAKIPNDITGKPLSIRLQDSKKTLLRFFHGIILWVEEMEEAPPDEFRWMNLGVCSLFEMLSLTEDTRIFSEMTASQIIEKILKENSVDFENKTTATGKEKREFCVQYKESHFHFVSRLMEEEGMFYFFTFKENKHILILCDDVKHYEVFKEDLSFHKSTLQNTLFSNHIWRFKQRQRKVLQSISLTDYWFEKPDQDLLVKKEGPKGSPSLERYDYPGRFGEKSPGENIANRRLEAAEALKSVCKGLSSAPALSAGVKFKLTKHPQDALNASYAILSIHHFYGLDRNGNPVVHNTFQAIPEKTPFRPLETTPKPFASQDTAKVMGPKGEEVYRDKYGRIKVKFHWDRRPEKDVKDEERSCWIRVASSWAGNGWGALYTPRIGQEVVVTFLNNNPDRPLVIGCVYNGTHLPPYADDPAKSTLKSHSTKQGQDENFNEIRFTDEKGKEEIFLQAEKDAHILIKDSVKTEIKGNTETKISGDRHVIIGADLEQAAKDKGKGDDFLTLEKGTRTIELKGSSGHLKTLIADGNKTLQIKKGNDETTLDHGNLTLSLKSGTQETTIKGGGYTLKVTGGDITMTTTGKLKVDAKQGISFSTMGTFSVDCMKFDVKSKTDLSLSATINLTAEGKVQSTLKGAMANVQGQAMTQVKGAMVMLN